MFQQPFAQKAANMGSAVSCKKGSDDPTPGFPAGHSDDYQENEMKEIACGDNGDKVIVVKYKDEFYAFGHKCPHYGANLATGVFRDGMIRCPWHGACFSTKTGDIEDFPGLENIPSFKVQRKDNGDLTVAATEQEVKITKVLKPLGKLSSNIAISDPSNNFSALPGLKTFVIIGAGAAGFTCAITLRQNKFDGRIVILSSDAYYPYDRTKISKSLNSDWNEIKLKEEKFFQDHDIEVLLNTTVERVDTGSKNIQLHDDERLIHYDSLMIASGLKPRKHTYEGVDLKNIYTVYSLKDTQEIKELAANKTVVIAGSSFIALELASSLDEVAVNTTIISRSKWPYGAVFGEVAGTALLEYVTKTCKNVVFESLDEIKSFEGNSKNEVTSVITMKNKVYLCDLVILAMGGIPSTDFIQNSDIKLNNGTILINQYMQTSDENIFAAGDVTTFPSNLTVSGHANIGHWGMALKHGKLAALSMLGNKTSISNSVPFFWTRIWGITVRYAGTGQYHNEMLVFGDVKEMKFCVVYRRDGVILSVLTVNCDPIAAQLAFDLENHVTYKEDEYPSYITTVFPGPPASKTIPTSKYEILPGAAEFVLAPK